MAKQHGNSKYKSVPRFYSNKYKVSHTHHVYFVRFEGESRFKIGRSSSARLRIMHLQGKLRKNHAEIYVIHTNDGGKCETYFHQKFADKRLNGEWFALTPEDISEIRKIDFVGILLRPQERHDGFVWFEYKQ